MEKRNVFGLFRMWLKKLGGMAALKALVEQVDSSSDGLMDMYEVLAMLRKVCSGFGVQGLGFTLRMWLRASWTGARCWRC
jgi:hypothetical protein